MAKSKNLATLTRRELRKQKRAAKSARKAAHFSRRRHRRGEDAHGIATAVNRATALQAEKLERGDSLRRGKLPRNLARSGSENKEESRQKVYV